MLAMNFALSSFRQLERLVRQQTRLLTLLLTSNVSIRLHITALLTTISCHWKPSSLLEFYSSPWRPFNFTFNPGRWCLSSVRKFHDKSFCHGATTFRTLDITCHCNLFCSLLPNGPALSCDVTNFRFAPNETSSCWNRNY